MTARFGYAFDNVLLYARGGVRHRGDKYDVSGGTFAGGDRSAFKGWKIALAGSSVAALNGRSRAIGPRTSNMTITGSDIGNIMMSDPFNGFLGGVDVRQNVQVVKVGLNFHIGGSGW